MSTHKKIFIDTEYTNFVNIHLISIGLVADSGEQFYAEVPYPANECSEFVRDVVIPLLGQEPNAAYAIDTLYYALMSWLKIVKSSNQDIEICYDSETDWILFEDAMGRHIPGWAHPRLVADQINELLRHEWHQKNGKPEHHALYDAQANCYAFRSPVIAPE